MPGTSRFIGMFQHVPGGSAENAGESQKQGLLAGTKGERQILQGERQGTEIRQCNQCLPTKVPSRKDCHLDVPTMPSARSLET